MRKVFIRFYLILRLKTVEEGLKPSHISSASSYPAFLRRPGSRNANTAAMATWRKMSVNNVDGVLCVADVIHPDLPESDYVFAERAKLFPEGCLVLVKDNEICGYALSHPIRHCQPPALDSLLGTLAPDADQYYIHDLAILPKFRGQGLATACIDKLLSIASRYSTTCLVSVYGTASFWARFGFVNVPIDAALSKKLHDYGEDAVYLSRQNNEMNTVSVAITAALSLPKQPDDDLESYPPT